MAHDLLAVPISIVASESAFSTGGCVLDVFRSCLTPKIVEALICTSDCLRLASSPILVEETLEDLEKFERGKYKLKLAISFSFFCLLQF